MIVVRLDFFSAALVFAREGLGIALVDPFTIISQKLNKVVIVPFKPCVSFDLIIIWAKDRPLSLIGESFISLLQQEMRVAENFHLPSIYKQLTASDRI